MQSVRIIVGRTRHQASALSAGLRGLGAEVIEIPFIEIRPPHSYKRFDAALQHISQYDWLILTSVNGAESLAARMNKLRLNRAAFQRLKIVAIGPSTRKAIEDLGLRVTLVPKSYIAESVVAGLRSRVRGKRVLLARAKIARDVIPRELRKMGAQVDVIEAYETVVPSSSRNRLRSLMADQKRRPDVITFTSSSTVRNFVKLLGGRGPALSLSKGRPSEAAGDRIRFASIGPITSATLRELGLPVDIEAKEFTIPGLVRAIQATGRPKSRDHQ